MDLGKKTASELSLLGLACGDAYGVAFEFMQPPQIKSAYPSMPTVSLGGGPFGFAKGSFSDDTQMSLLSLYWLVHCDISDTDKLSELFIIWGYGAEDIGIGTQKALFGKKEATGNQGNGALMRIVPSIIYMYETLGFSAQSIKALVRKMSSITHEDSKVHSVNDFFIDYILHNPLKEHNSLPKEILNSCGNSGWVINTARIVYQALQKGPIDFTEALWGIVKQGGDTDTACAIYGAIYAYHYPQLFCKIRVDCFLSNQSLAIINSFQQCQLHHYRPDPKLLPNLYAGQYPGSKHTPLHAIKIHQLLQLKPDVIVCLMEEKELSRFAPYKKQLKHFNPKLDIVLYPIKDMATPSSAMLISLLRTIDALLLEQRLVYVHCWGGHGRTGLVAGAMLIQKGYSPNNALAQIKKMRLGSGLEHEPSPQTQQQIEMLRHLASNVLV